jgi:hypothetical protein
MGNAPSPTNVALKMSFPEERYFKDQEEAGSSG